MTYVRGTVEPKGTRSLGLSPMIDKIIVSTESQVVSSRLSKEELFQREKIIY